MSVLVPAGSPSGGFVRSCCCVGVVSATSVPAFSPVVVVVDGDSGGVGLENERTCAVARCSKFTNGCIFLMMNDWLVIDDG